jgi:hypothetical protein
MPRRGTRRCLDNCPASMLIERSSVNGMAKGLNPKNDIVQTNISYDKRVDERDAADSNKHMRRLFDCRDLLNLLYVAAAIVIHRGK